ncbi:MAG: hypothetical protein K6G00_06030 [Treponema sp.]|nr:hypothetical protein [Treponema sp.]
MPVSKIWNGYKVLYVDKSVNEEDVLNCLYESGCKDVISMSLQRAPVSTPFSAFQKDYNSYLESRLGYFMDKNASCKLFYIPDQYERQAGTALKKLIKNFHVKAGLDADSSVPYIVPVITVAVYVLLGLASEKKRYFFLPAFFLVVLSFSMPFYTVAAGSCLVLFALYLSNKVWGRKSDVIAVLKKVEIDILLFASIIILCSYSVACGLLSVAALCALSASILLLKESLLQNDRQSSFRYTLIFSAYQVSVINRKNMKALLFLTIPISVILISFLFSAKFMPRTSAAGIELPVPVSDGDRPISENSVFLPSINNYFVWAWNTLTYPYRSVNYNYSETVAEGDSIYFSTYEQKSDSVQEKEAAIYTFNSDFRKKLEKELDGLDYPAVEQLMKLQDHRSSVIYALSRQPAQSGSDILNLVMLIMALSVPLALSLSYYYGVERRI